MERTFIQAIGHGIEGLAIAADNFIFNLQHRIVEQALPYRLPVVYDVRVFPEAGGLVSYGADVVETWLQAGQFAGKILNGESVAELPVLQPTKFELVINLKTAKALGLTIPPSLLGRGDQVIE